MELEANSCKFCEIVLFPSTNWFEPLLISLEPSAAIDIPFLRLPSWSKIVLAYVLVIVEETSAFIFAIAESSILEAI